MKNLYEEIKQGLNQLVQDFPEDRGKFDDIFYRIADYRKKLVLDQTSENPSMDYKDSSRLLEMMSSVKASAVDILDVLQVRDLTRALKESREIKEK